MLKNIKNAREISLSNVLSERYVTIDHVWTNLDNESANELFELFKNYIAKTARGARRNRIQNTQRWMLRDYGIFRRLVYNFERERVEYICGQDWDSEMAILRDCFDK